MILLALSPSALPVLDGFDVVAYQTLPAGANGTRGSPRFAFNLTTTDQSNSTGGERMKPTNYEFHFESAANRDLFAADPWKYTPAWGGF